MQRNRIRNKPYTYKDRLKLLEEWKEVFEDSLEGALRNYMEKPKTTISQWPGIKHKMEHLIELDYRTAEALKENTPKIIACLGKYLPKYKIPGEYFKVLSGIGCVAWESGSRAEDIARNAPRDIELVLQNSKKKDLKPYLDMLRWAEKREYKPPLNTYSED